jgi:hypothetical protein
LDTRRISSIWLPRRTSMLLKIENATTLSSSELQ